MPATGAVEELAMLRSCNLFGSCRILVLRLTMSATCAVEELAMLTKTLLVLRLAMPATGASHASYNLIGVETDHASLWDLALSATVCSRNWLWLGRAVTDGHASSWFVLILSRVLLLRRHLATKITCLSGPCAREFPG